MKFLILIFLLQFTGISFGNENDRYDNYQTYYVRLNNVSRKILNELVKIYDNEKASNRSI